MVPKLIHLVEILSSRGGIIVGRTASTTADSAGAIVAEWRRLYSAQQQEDNEESLLDEELKEEVVRDDELDIADAGVPSREAFSQHYFRDLVQQAQPIQQRTEQELNKSSSDQQIFREEEEKVDMIAPLPPAELSEVVQSRMEFSRQHFRNLMRRPAAPLIQPSEQDAIPQQQQPNLQVNADEEYLYLAQ